MKIKVNYQVLIILAGLAALLLAGFAVIQPGKSTHPHYTLTPLPTSNAGTLLLLSDGEVQQLDVAVSGAITGTLQTASDQTQLSERCVRAEQVASPDGRNVAFKVYCDEQSYTQVMDITTGEIRTIQPTSDYPESTFLGWTPDGASALLWTGSMIESDQVMVVNLETGESEALDTPAYTYSAAISPDNELVLFTVTKGLGWGGELWMMNRDGGHQKMLLQEQQHIIAFPQWSPGGEFIAYIRMIDSNIPFTVGELCLADGDGRNQRCIPQAEASADTGHGYPLIWSPDGKWVAFIVRANPNDRRANEDPAALRSNIFLADPVTSQAHPLTQFDDALVDGIAWSPNGLQLAFRKTENGFSDIWVIDIATGELQQVTQNGNAQSPVWIGQK
jgi:Tol biopolymer transport system component